MTFPNPFNVRTVSGGKGGIGDVVGPASSTDNAIARFDGTGGTTLQDSLGVIDDSGHLTLADAAGPALQNEAPTATNPTIVPNKTDLDTGIGWASGALVLVVNGANVFAVDAALVNPGSRSMNTGIADRPDLVWSAAATATAPGYRWQNDIDTGVGRAGPDQLSLIAGAIEGIRITTTQVISLPVSGATANLNSATTELTALSGATVTATNLIPAGSFIYGVTARVTTLIAGATTWDIGDGVDVDRWGAAIALAAGTTTNITDFTAAGFGQFSSANDVVLTANVANFTAGAVRLVVHYIDLTPPTS